MTNDQASYPDTNQLRSAEQDDSEEPIELDEAERQDLLEAEPVPQQVTYSGQDFDVEGLVRRMTKHDILVPTFGHDDERISSAGFQRGFVWTRPQMDRFIESLLLGYPIPGIFLVRQADRRYLVLDGQQRLRTLQHFYEGRFAGREFALNNVGDRLQGLTYSTLPEEQRRQLEILSSKQRSSTLMVQGSLLKSCIKSLRD